MRFELLLCAPLLVAGCSQSVSIVPPEPVPSETISSEVTVPETAPSEVTPHEPTPSETVPTEVTPSEPTPSQTVPTELTRPEPTPSQTVPSVVAPQGEPERCPAMACAYEPCPPGVEPPTGCAAVCGCAGMRRSGAIQVAPAPPP